MRTSLQVALALALFAATFAAYAGTLNHEFVAFDDQDYVYANPVVSDGLTVDGVRWAFGYHFSNWYPLTWLSHMLDCELFGLDAGRHHATSVLLHAATAALVFLALAALTQSAGPSWFVAALFALHPLRVESVAWIAERKDVLSGLFFATTLLSYAFYVRAPSPARYAIVAVSFALGLMAKPILVTLPALLLLLDFWPLDRGRSARRLVREKLPLFALSALSAFLTMRSQIALDEAALSQRLLNGLLSTATYLGKTIWPADLACFYPHPAVVAPDTLTFGNPAIGISAFVLVAATWFALVNLLRRPWVAVGWFWFVGLLVPVLGLFQIGRHGHADRYTYLPSIGLAVAVVFTFVELARSPRARRALAGLGLAVLAAWSVLTWRQAATWATTETLFEHALAVTENNYKAHNALGLELKARGDVDGARAHYEAALAILPEHPRALTNLGLIHQERNELDEAHELYERALAGDPLQTAARCNLAVLLLSRNDLTGAIGHLETAIANDPDSALGHYLLGRALASSGHPDAQRHLQRAAELDPKFTEPR